MDRMPVSEQREMARSLPAANRPTSSREAPSCKLRVHRVGNPQSLWDPDLSSKVWSVLYPSHPHPIVKQFGGVARYMIDEIHDDKAMEYLLSVNSQPFIFKVKGPI